MSNYTNTKKLYDALINAGYTTDNIGDKQTFINYMRDENTREQMYRYIHSNNDFRIGDYNTYLSRIAADFDNTSTTTDDTPSLNFEPTTYNIYAAGKIPMPASKQIISSSMLSPSARRDRGSAVGEGVRNTDNNLPNTTQPSLTFNHTTGQYDINQHPITQPTSTNPVGRAWQRQLYAPITPVTITSQECQRHTQKKLYQNI